MIEFKPKTDYYTIVTNEQLDTLLPDVVVDIMGYDKNKTHTLRSACFPYPQELEDGRFLIGIQLSNKDEYDNRCVKGFIKQDAFNLAVKFYGIDNIFTDTSKLKFK